MKQSANIAKSKSQKGNINWLDKLFLNPNTQTPFIPKPQKEKIVDYYDDYWDTMLEKMDKHKGWDFLYYDISHKNNKNNRR